MFTEAFFLAPGKKKLLKDPYFNFQKDRLKFL